MTTGDRTEDKDTRQISTKPKKIPDIFSPRERKRSLVLSVALFVKIRKQKQEIKVDSGNF